MLIISLLVSSQRFGLVQTLRMFWKEKGPAISVLPLRPRPDVTESITTLTLSMLMTQTLILDPGCWLS